MTVSFYINKNDLQELNHLVENCNPVGPFETAKYEEKALSIECFASISEIDRISFKANLKLNFIQVNIDYIKYNAIKEYLKF